MLALILDSLGSTELLFILVIALIFFGPRKLPQLARSMGKSLAEFRKASEDFKRTWEREVALESTRTDTAENSILGDEPFRAHDDAPIIEAPAIDAVQPELVVPRQNMDQRLTEPSSVAREAEKEAASVEPLRKRDWL